MPIVTAPASVETITRLRLVVMRLSRLLRQQSADELSPTLTSTLSTVERRGPLTLGELAAAERVQPPSMTRAVARLEERGLVTRVPDPVDRRTARVSISAAGSKTLTAARRRKNAYLAERLTTLTAEERASLERALPLLERLVGDQL